MKWDIPQAFGHAQFCGEQTEEVNLQLQVFRSSTLSHDCCSCGTCIWGDCEVATRLRNSSTLVPVDCDNAAFCSGFASETKVRKLP